MATSTVFNSSGPKLPFLGSSPLSQEKTDQLDCKLEIPTKRVWIANLWDASLMEAELSAKKQWHLQVCACPAFQGNPGDTFKWRYSPRRVSTEGEKLRPHDTLEVMKSSEERRQKKMLANLNCSSETIQADSKTVISALLCCIRNKTLEEGRRVHSHIIEIGITLDTFLGNTLINMYATCGRVMDAHRVFNTVPAEKNVVTWTTLIAAYANNGPVDEAFKLFWQMEHEGVKPDNVTFVSILKACSNLRDLERGKQIHLHIIETGFKPNSFVGNTLIDMYSKCGSIQDARQVFDNMPERSVASWNAMISSYIQFGKDEEAVQIFKQMERQGVMTNQITLICVLKACARLTFIEEGKKLHTRIVKSGYDSDVFVASTLVDMYAKSGSLNEARQIFDNIANRDVVTWNAMMAGYAKHGHEEAALNLFQRMEKAGIKPDEVTYLSVLNSCASLAALRQGKKIHAQILKSGTMLSPYLVSTLIDMYAKCGSLNDASLVFDEMVPRDVVSWNAMMNAYGQHGHGRRAIQLFEQMQLEGIKVDNVSFVCVLSACSHEGFVVEGSSYFHSMLSHGITATTEHYACMVDLLGRAGYINEAADFIDSMPVPSCAVVWRTLLGACRNQKNVELARNASECIRKLDPQNDSAYVLLSNTYAAAER